MTLEELQNNPIWSNILMSDTWAEYEKPLDMTDWPIEWIRQIPKVVRMR